MPGMETAAPERTETSSGRSRAAEVTVGRGLEPLQTGLDLGSEPGRKLPSLEVGDAERCGDGESGRNRNAEVGHLGETGALAAQHVLHGGGAVGAALPEEVD